MYDDLKTLQISVEAGVGHVTINHPQVKMLEATLIGDLSRFVTDVRDDSDVRVVVLQSADPRSITSNAAGGKPASSHKVAERVHA